MKPNKVAVLRVAAAALNVAVLVLAWTHYLEWSRVDRFAGVGGPEAYRASRQAQLEQARGRLEHLAPEVKARELAAIDDQLEELERGLTAQEMGGEARRVK